MNEAAVEQATGKSTHGWILCALVVLTVALRLVHSHGQSVTFDEHYEIELAKQPISEIVIRGDGFPPLYASILHCWDKVIGSEHARYMSILFAALGCVAVYRLGTTVGGRRVGLWSAFLLAVLPIHMFYTSEARAYSLLLLITTMAMNAWFKALDDDWTPWIVFSLWTVAGLHTHYLFAVFPAMLLLISLIYVRSIKPFASGALIILLAVPISTLWFAPDFAMQAGYTYRIDFGLAELAFAYGSFLLGNCLGPSLRTLHGIDLRSALIEVLPWAVAFTVSLVTMIWSARKELPWKKRETTILLLLLLTPIVVGLLCTMAQVGYNARYALWFIIPNLVALGIVADRAWNRPIGRVATITLVALFLVALYNRTQIDDYRNEDIQSVAAILESTQPQPLPVLVVSGYMVEPLKHYIDASQHQLEAIPMTSSFDDRLVEMETILSRLETTGSEFWLVYTREFHEDSDGKLTEMIRSRATIEEKHRFAGVVLYRGSFEP